MNAANGINFEILGTTGYTSALRTFVARVPMAALTATTVKLPLFIFPKGTIVVGCRATVTQAADAAAAVTLDVGTYKITDGDVGAAIDADALYAASNVADAAEGAILAAAATAHGMTVTEDAAVVAVPKAVTTAATEGEVLIEVWAVP